MVCAGNVAEQGRSWGLTNTRSHPFPVSVVRKQSSPRPRRTRVADLSKEVVWTIDHYFPPQPILSAPLQLPKDKSLQTWSFYPGTNLSLVCLLHTELISSPDLVIADCRAICPSLSTLWTSSLTARSFIMCLVFLHCYWISPTPWSMKELLVSPW